MKKTWLKYLGMMLVISMMITGFSWEVRAEDQEVTEIEVPCHHTTTETETEVSDTSEVIQRGAYLASGTTKLTDKGNCKVGIYGCTSAYQDCDTLYLDIYLERSADGESWYYYDSWSYTATQVSSLSKSFTRTVPGQYYYRLRGYHAAKEGSVKESTSTMTSGLYIE